MRLPTIPIDKQAHALGGAVIVLMSSIAGQPLWIGLLECAFAALAKEVYDTLHPDVHTADIWDFGATFMGGLVAALLSNVVECLK